MVRGEQIGIRPTDRLRYSLADFVAQITVSNGHDLIESGPSVGRELW
jgi:antitoxin component of MazEF toxin-antitoxin module